MSMFCEIHESDIYSNANTLYLLLTKTLLVTDTYANHACSISSSLFAEFDVTDYFLRKATTPPSPSWRTSYIRYSANNTVTMAANTARIPARKMRKSLRKDTPNNRWNSVSSSILPVFSPRWWSVHGGFVFTQNIIYLTLHVLQRR